MGPVFQEMVDRINSGRNVEVLSSLAFSFKRCDFTEHVRQLKDALYDGITYHTLMARNIAIVQHFEVKV